MLTAAEAGLLNRLTLASGSASAAAGARDARTRGQGLEFEDYRGYLPGDDPRSIDWTIHARLRQLFVRVFRAEGHLRLHLLVDASRSMSVGSPSKFQCAARLASALAYVAVERRDAVGMALFDGRIRTLMSPAPGRPHLFRLFNVLSHADADGGSDIDRALVSYATATRGPGIAVVISDYQSSAHIGEGLRYLLYRGLTPVVVQILADDELCPEVQGDVQLADAEDPLAPPFTVDASSVPDYVGRLSGIEHDLREFCRANGLAYIRVIASTPFGTLVRQCVAAGLLAPHA